MKHFLLLLFTVSLFFTSCEPQVKEVEKIVEVVKNRENDNSDSSDNSDKNTPSTKDLIPKTDFSHSGYLTIHFFQPNDNENSVILTNDKALINIQFSSPDSIVKAVWKKGVKNYGVKPSVLLSDNSANNLSIDTDSKSSFYVTENGWYDVVAEDSIGRYEWEQVEVKTIDKTPPEEVINLNAEYANGNITVSWELPLDSESPYQNSVDKLRISYIYNQKQNDSDNGEFEINKTTSATIQRAASKTDITYMQIKVQTLDSFGNLSSGITTQTECFDTIYATVANAAQKISDLSFGGKVIVTGEYNNSFFSDIKTAISSKNRKVILDLSGIIGMTEIPAQIFSAFYKLESIVIPEGVTKIDYSSFSSCWDLKEVILPDSLISINGHAFASCYKLTHIIIPRNVRYIGQNAFYNCHLSLSDVTFKDVTTTWYRVDDGNGVGHKIDDLRFGQMSATDTSKNAQVLTEFSPNYPERYTFYYFNENYNSN